MFLFGCPENIYTRIISCMGTISYIEIKYYYTKNMNTFSYLLFYYAIWPSDVNKIKIK